MHFVLEDDQNHSRVYLVTRISYPEHENARNWGLLCVLSLFRDPLRRALMHTRMNSL